MSSYCLSFLSHGPVETAAAAIRLGGRWPVAVQHVLRARPKCASFRRSRTVLRGYASIVGALVTPSGDDEIIAAAGKEASEEWMVERAEKLKDDVRRLFQTSDSTERRMQLVDAVQHLGTDHLFKEEIEYSLSEINASEFISSSLHDVALRFRLLRQHGFRVSLDVFNKFKGDDGRFVSGITDDPRGLLSLYNAAHLLTHDEPELEEAITFATQHLASLSSGTDLNPHLIDQINRAFDVPLPRTFRRMESLYHMSEYRQEEGHIPILLELAKLDFNLLQHVHLRELKAISEWWKDLYGYMGLSYIRDHVVESYVWSYVVFYEEGSALARMIFTKIIVFIILMDDTYDSYATIQECRKLNEAIQRWDESATPFLPEYMKKFYRALLKTFKEFEIHVEDDGQNRIDHTKKASSVTSTVPLLCVSTTVDRGDALTKEAFESAANETSAKTVCAKITRFMNDIAAFKRRRKNRGDVASTVECYMNENKVTSEDAFTKIDSMIEDEWRTINQALCEQRDLLPAVQQVLNLSICATFFYGKRKDAYTFSAHLQETVESLFVKPVPI
uniref:Terpene synthase N-terminal domain-containing protein n=2 Tax=Oryza TaxID=4527 RepID=A0A0D3FUD3_9ORYZ